MKLVMMMIVVLVVALMVKQKLSIASKAKDGISSIYSEGDCLVKRIDVKRMPNNTPEAREAIVEFMGDCKE